MKTEREAQTVEEKLVFLYQLTLTAISLGECALFVLAVQGSKPQIEIMERELLKKKRQGLISPALYKSVTKNLRTVKKIKFGEPNTRGATQDCYER